MTGCSAGAECEEVESLGGLDIIRFNVGDVEESEGVCL